MQIRQFPNPEALAFGAAEFICGQAQERIARSGSFSLVLSGGSTPTKTYRQLVHLSNERELEWSKVQVYWGDERCVPPDHAQSNYRMAREALFNQISIPDENLHRMVCEGNPEAGAEKYEHLLRSQFDDRTLPRFDLILLGLGDDGHTASLFPDTAILEERERWVAPVFVPRLNSWRISLTLPAINATAHVAFLVSGAGKSAILKEILESTTPSIYPAQLVAPQGELTWMIDYAAGQHLEN
jgi:6-phosphogluconolactonase